MPRIWGLTPIVYLTTLLMSGLPSEGQTGGQKPHIASVLVKISPPKWEANVTNRCECEGAITQMLGTVGLMMDRLDRQNIDMKKQEAMIRKLQERLDNMEPYTSAASEVERQDADSREVVDCGCGPSLIPHTRQQMLDMYLNITSPYQSSLFTLSQKLKQFVLGRIRMEERENVVYFTRTFGLLFQKNKPLFKRLFNDMYDYIDGKSIDLEGKVIGFFRDLSNRLFRLLYHVTLDQRYGECLERLTYQDDFLNKGFLAVHLKLGKGLRQASQATRGLIYGLKSGAKVMNDLSTLPLTEECVQAAARMKYCPRCDVRPCQGFCVNVMKGCYAQFWELSRKWRTYIDALEMLQERVLSVFNIDVVLNTVSVHISDAVMNYQENYVKIRSEVTKACGPLPRFSSKRQRHRRAAKDAISYEFKRDMLTQDMFKRMIESARRTHQRASDNLWQHLHTQICSQVAKPFTEKEMCWNGTHISRYLPNEVAGGLIAQQYNPEVLVHERTTNAMVSQLRLDLDQITEVLMSTHKGRDTDGIEYIDTETQSGSGSGVDDEDM